MIKSLSFSICEAWVHIPVSPVTRSTYFPSNGIKVKGTRRGTSWEKVWDFPKDEEKTVKVSQQWETKDQGERVSQVLRSRDMELSEPGDKDFFKRRIAAQILIAL